MKTMVYRGERLLGLEEHAVPMPGHGESLLKVVRVGVCGTDLMIFKGGMPHRAGPGRILGHEMVAEVVEPCPGGPFFKGDRVVVEPTVFCGSCAACRAGHSHVCQHLRFFGIDLDGAFREFWAVPDNRLHRVPEAITSDHAPLIEPLAVAVHDVRLSGVKAGETVVVIGGGTIGFLIALLARRKEARVIVLDTNPHRVAFARSQGFESYDPAEAEGAVFIGRMREGAGAGVVFESSGSAGGARLMTRLAGVRARLMVVGIQDGKTEMDLFQVFYRELSLQGARAYTGEDFREAIHMMASGEVNVGALVSRRFPLEELNTAMEWLLSGTAAMKVLIDIGERTEEGGMRP
jgi:2-desacetyl-2-hydroxyethyl bacteriochlorophyllide A dehydrogenase